MTAGEPSHDRPDYLVCCARGHRAAHRIVAVRYALKKCAGIATLVPALLRNEAQAQIALSGKDAKLAVTEAEGLVPPARFLRKA